MPVRALLRALLARDETGAGQVLDSALALSGQRVAIVADLVQPVVAALDDLWYRGEIRASSERWAMAALAAAARRMPRTPTLAPVPPGSRIVLAALDPEEHAVGMDLLAMALRDDGWEVAPLGSCIPSRVLLEVVSARRPDVVGLSASCLPAPARFAETVAVLKARRIKVLVGGQAFARVHGLWQEVGADSYGVDARAGVALARRLLPDAVLLRPRPAISPRMLPESGGQ
jgi:MerR family transcriptional regulator, light-induced transcriptional regulator